MTFLIGKFVFRVWFSWAYSTRIVQVGSCRDVNNILSKIPCDGMDDEQTQSVSRMKEIVSTIVTRRAKVTATRREPVESVW